METHSALKSVRVFTLGGFRLQVDGRELSDEINRSQKLWNVLCYLIAHRSRSVSQSELIGLFWPEESSVNPTNALKTLLYRVRTLLEPLFVGWPEPIISQRGSYAWNRAVQCQVDADLFESLCRKASDRGLADGARMELYRQALELYRGDYLPKLEHQMWVLALSAHYHALYVAAVKEYAGLLDGADRYQEMSELCCRASQMDPLDEGLHTLVVRSLLRQGRNTAALAHYEKATDLLYRNLGVHPSEELRALYTEIMSVQKSLETDLEVIQQNLMEVAARPGAFICEYGFFKEAYRLEARRMLRSGACVHLALLTVALPDGGIPPLDVLNHTMDQLLEVLATHLRRSDVVSRYSGAQYVIMLPSANFENSNMVMDRIVTTFYRQHRRNFLKLSYQIRDLDLPGGEAAAPIPK